MTIIIFNTDFQKVDVEILKEAIIGTTNKRGTINLMASSSEVIQKIQDSEYQKNLWVKYQKQFAYAIDISFEKVMDDVETVITMVL